MTENQWNKLVSIVNGEYSGPPVSAFIIDSPWLPGWHGISNLTYYNSEEAWFKANMAAINEFPEAIFLPGFWSEYGMCTEPSAFGAKLVWLEGNLPHAEKIITSNDQIKDLQLPNVKTDGLLPFMLHRLVSMESRINKEDHHLKFAVARGPLNIASFLMGTSELMMMIMLEPETTHKLLETITQFTINWLQLQKESLKEIEAILILDDIVGFIGQPEVEAFAVPYIKRIFNSFETQVRLFHNDAQGLVSTPFIKEMGVNLYNFSFEHSINEIRKLAGSDIALLGNLPPRDVLAAGTPDEVKEWTNKMYTETLDKNRILWSCGGGMPQDVPSENINAFLSEIKRLS